MEVFGAFYLKCHKYSKICQLWTLIIFEIILPIKWQRVSVTLVCMTPSLRSRIWKSSCTIAVTASFKFSRSSSGFIWVSTICVSVAVNPYKCSYSVISRVKLIIVFTQKDTVLHGVAVPPSWTYNAAIMSSCKQPIANISHFHCTFTMFDITVKTGVILVSIGFLLSGQFAPCNGDVLSFQALLANYTAQKHVGSSPNLTSDEEMHRSPATWPSQTESEAFLP